MATLTSASTLAEIKAAYIDNASYAEDGDTTKARAFVTACRILLLKLPKRASFGRGLSDQELDLGVLRDELRTAQRYLAGRGSAAIRHADLRDFRT